MIICRRARRNKGVINYFEKVTSILINLKKWCYMLQICNPCSNLPFTGPVAFLSSKYGKRAIKGLKTYSCSQNSTVLKGSMINRKILWIRLSNGICLIVKLLGKKCICLITVYIGYLFSKVFFLY